MKIGRRSCVTQSTVSPSADGQNSSQPPVSAMLPWGRVGVNKFHPSFHLSPMLRPSHLPSTTLQKG